MRLYIITAKTIKNFFVDNYNEEIKDDTLICTDLIYYSKNLENNQEDSNEIKNSWFREYFF